MEFLRKNLFMVLLVTITSLLVVVLLIWGMNISDRIETEEMTKRKTLSRDINALQGGPYVNRETIKADTERVAVVRKALADVRRLNREYNSRDYNVAQLKLLTGQTRPALPFSAKVWDDNQLYFRFVSEYHRKLEELLTRLNATTPPKEEDIFAEAIRQQSSIDLREMIKQKNAPVGVPGAGVGEMHEMGGRRPGGIAGVAGAGRTIIVGKRINPDTGHEENIAVGEEALEIAQTNLKLHQAVQGQIYAAETSLDIDPQYPKGGGIVGTIPPEKIWDLQVGLWVQSDVIDVIGRTIQDVMSTPAMKGKRPGVINSPIKKLVQIRVTPIGSKESISRTTDSTRRGDMMYGDMMTERPGGRSRRRPVDRYAPRQLPQAETLTRNVSNQLYDVVRYQFTVLMPTRYLPILERNLAKQNYHIILNEEISKVGAPIGAGQTKTTGRPMDQPAAEDSLYYYGTEPIRQITISAELLLLTDWVRGTYDVKEEKWIRPPLMPVEVMKKILSPAALRPEDRELIEGKLPMPWRNPST